MHSFSFMKITEKHFHTKSVIYMQAKQPNFYFLYLNKKRGRVLKHLQTLPCYGLSLTLTKPLHTLQNQTLRLVCCSPQQQRKKTLSNSFIAHNTKVLLLAHLYTYFAFICVHSINLHPTFTNVSPVQLLKNSIIKINSPILLTTINQNPTSSFNIIQCLYPYIVALLIPLNSRST